jgi:C-terminal processing protease CtpA/Prc
LSTPGLAGNIGGAVLRRFVVTFDYARNAVWLAPNARLAAPFDVDRSGLRIHANDGGFDVVAVMAGSPADEAGLRVGDRIVAVDGTSTAAIALHAQRRAWQASPAGTRVGVRVTREAAAFDASLVLRDLIPAA